MSIRAIRRANIKAQMKKEMAKDKVTMKDLKRTVMGHINPKKEGYKYLPTLHNLACMLFGEWELMN